MNINNGKLHIKHTIYSMLFKLYILHMYMYILLHIVVYVPGILS